MLPVLISQLRQLSNIDKGKLERGKFSTVSDVVLTPWREIAKKCKTGLPDVTTIVKQVCQESAGRVQRLGEVLSYDDESFTTGDAKLDNALGGGIRTGMIWELTGESAAGKTQLALQLALSVQLPRESGGLSGCTCYLTTSSQLPTSRLSQIIDRHPCFSAVQCGLNRIHTISTPTISILLHVLSQTLPTFLQVQSDQSTPVRLLVIDALAQLFHSTTESAKDKLVDRSRSIADISALLHSLGYHHRIAILIISETSDVFDPVSISNVDDDRDMTYREQALWFSRAHSTWGEDRKEARLGLPWANQVNARLLVSRTCRRKSLLRQSCEELAILTDKQTSHSSIHNDVQHPCGLDLIRRSSVVFSCVGKPISLDYIITMAGFRVIPSLL